MTENIPQFLEIAEKILTDQGYKQVNHSQPLVTYNTNQAMKGEVASTNHYATFYKAKGSNAPHFVMFVDTNGEGRVVGMSVPAPIGSLPQTPYVTTTEFVEKIGNEPVALFFSEVQRRETEQSLRDNPKRHDLPSNGTRPRRLNAGN